MTHRKKTLRLAERMRKMRDSGMSQADIARRLNVGVGWVSTLIGRHEGSPVYTNPPLRTAAHTKAAAGLPACPRCGAGADEPCRAPSGDTRSPHAARMAGCEVGVELRDLRALVNEYFEAKWALEEAMQHESDLELTRDGLGYVNRDPECIAARAVVVESENRERDAEARLVARVRPEVAADVAAGVEDAK